MTSKSITIIGGGLAGLTLGHCLKRRGIAAVIYDRHPGHPQSNYGINLHRSTYLPLLPYLGIDEKSFREKVAIKVQSKTYGDDPLRCHRGRLEKLLRTNLAIHWNRKLASIELGAGNGSVVAHFEDGESIKTKTLVGCDGPHSRSRKSLCSKSELHVLPCLVVNGTRRVSIAEYEKTFEKWGPPARTLIGSFPGHYLRLEVTVNDVTEDHAFLSDTYSQYANEHDPDIHEPNRSNADAEIMPQAFEDEVESFSFLDSRFMYIFEENIRRLHWLMRVVRPDRDEVMDLAGKGVILIGDAIHAEPILGGEGANAAIRDGIELAEYIAEHADDYAGFVESKFDGWVQSVERSEKKLLDMHWTREGFNAYRETP